VLQCVAVCCCERSDLCHVSSAAIAWKCVSCRLLRFVAVCCSVLQCVVWLMSRIFLCNSLEVCELQVVAVYCCGVLRCAVGHKSRIFLCNSLEVCGVSCSVLKCIVVVRCGLA